VADHSYVDMKGRTCLVTGANRGIGRASAVGLAQMGADLILLCRDRKRGEAVRQEIAAIAGVGDVELLVCDLGSQRQIRAVAAKFLSTSRPLHVLINNAGRGDPSISSRDRGWDRGDFRHQSSRSVPADRPVVGSDQAERSRPHS